MNETKRAFAADQSFELKDEVARARSTAQSLSAGVSEERLEAEPGASREMRDRAFTYLDELVSEVRAAGRYAFRGQPEFSKRFSSRYRRRTRGSKSSSAKPKVEVVEEEVVGEQTFVA